MQRVLAAIGARLRRNKVLVAVLMISLVGISNGTVSDVFASGVAVVNKTGSTVAIHSSQYTISACVKSIKSTQVNSSGNDVKSVEVKTSGVNTCQGANLQVYVLSDKGKSSNGAIQNIKLNDDTFVVNVSGNAKKNGDPKVVVNIY